MLEAEVKDWIRDRLFRETPSNVAVIAPDFRIIEANAAFASTFGDWKGKRCHEVYKGFGKPCPECRAVKTFSDGKVRTFQEIGVDRAGQQIRYMAHIFPIVNEKTGEIPYIIEMSADTTFITELQDRYHILFDRTPCYISIIDRDFRVTQANRKFCDTFGEPSGRYCYQSYKRREEKCENCPAELAFRTGHEHSASQTGVDKDGFKTHYIVTASPLSKALSGEVEYVIEIAVDVTRNHALEAQLKQTFDLQETVIRNSIDAMIAIDGEGKTTIFNPSAEKMFGYSAQSVIGVTGLFEKLGLRELSELRNSNLDSLMVMETSAAAETGEEIPVRLSGARLTSEDRFLGSAAFIQDLREIKRLEEEKITAERLAAVGQTVSGLAHGIKNIITGLEGGLYVMQTGLRKSEVEKVQKGLEMLDGNISRISRFVKEFLSFARGREPEVTMSSPNGIAAEVYDLYKEASVREGIELEFAPGSCVGDAPFDPEGIHTCLANLVSNAIDACQMSDKSSKKVSLSSAERDGAIIFEVTDNGIGMECEIKKKVFTSFFSTKGTHQGTGLGLLITRKIIQEHGGKVEIDSETGVGSTFRIILPRKSLPKPKPTG